MSGEIGTSVVVLFLVWSNMISLIACVFFGISFLLDRKIKRMQNDLIADMQERLIKAMKTKDALVAANATIKAMDAKVEEMAVILGWDITYKDNK